MIPQMSMDKLAAARQQLKQAEETVGKVTRLYALSQWAMQWGGQMLDQMEFEAEQRWQFGTAPLGGMPQERDVVVSLAKRILETLGEPPCGCLPTG